MIDDNEQPAIDHLYERNRYEEETPIYGGLKAQQGYLRAHRCAQEAVRAGILGEPLSGMAARYPDHFDKYRLHAASLANVMGGAGYFERRFAVTPYRLQLD